MSKNSWKLSQMNLALKEIIKVKENIESIIFCSKFKHPDQICKTLFYTYLTKYLEYKINLK